MLTRRLDNTWDMSFGKGMNNFARDAEATGQKVKTRLLLLRAEWFLDTSAGVPYLQQIMVKPADLPLAESLIKQCILATEGVLEIISFTMTLNPENRKLSVETSIRTTYDDISTIKVNFL